MSSQTTIHRQLALAACPKTFRQDYQRGDERFYAFPHYWSTINGPAE